MKRMIACVVVGASAMAAPLHGQTRWERGGQGWCDRDRSGGDNERSCQVLTTTVAAPARLTVDGGRNGGVSISGWDRNDMEIRAKVWANASSLSRAEAIAAEVTVRVDNGRISADGPSNGRRESWGVSYEISVPRTTDLQIDTHNGGIDVDGVRGEIGFEALNGGVRLVDVAGDVRGHTTNGGLHVELAGNRWEGAGLDVETTNGGVRLILPESYSAQLVTGTVNGGIDIGFPVTVRGRIGRRLETTLGNGGPTIRAVTTNGGVHIERR